MDTIFALASARGKAGVSVVRISGPKAHETVIRLCGSLPEPRKVSLRSLYDQNGEILDRALVVIFHTGHSFTGEETAELHLHGSVATVNTVLRQLGSLDGLRMAEPGEFTRRALDNDRLDLAQVEGLSDLIEAETEAQRKQAMRVFTGALTDKAEKWRADLIRAAALIEATIDFADEDVPIDVRPEVLNLITGVSTELQKESRGIGIAERVREGFEVAIVGAPNTGKSTLLNYLSGRDAAITSEIAGTTRDVIEVRMDIGGIPITLLDTAGVRDTDDTIEAIGVQRTLKRAQQADIRVFLLDAAGDTPILPPVQGDVMRVAKGDLLANCNQSVSGLTGMGVQTMLDEIVKELERRVASVGVSIKERHRTALNRAVAALKIASSEVLAGEDRSDIAAEELRGAIVALDSLVGRVDVEHILDEIFSRFCIGK